jgi:hypothetical protein
MTDFEGKLGTIYCSSADKMFMGIKILLWCTYVLVSNKDVHVTTTADIGMCWKEYDSVPWMKLSYTGISFSTPQLCSLAAYNLQIHMSSMASLISASSILAEHNIEPHWSK